MNRRRIIGIVVALVLGLGTIGGVFIYIQGHAGAAAKPSAQTKQVFVVNAAVPAGTSGADVAKAVKLTPVEESIVPAGAVTDLTLVKTLVTNTDLLPGEVLLMGRFVDASKASTPATPSGVPSGLQQMSITVKSANVAGGAVAAGNLIGVIAVVQTTDTPVIQSGSKLNNDATAKLVLDKLPVTAVVGSSAAQTRPQPAPSSSASPSSNASTTTTSTGNTVASGSLLITVAVTASQAEKLAWLITQNYPLYLTIQDAKTDDHSSQYTTAKVVFS